MHPELTLADIFGPDATYNPRASYRNYGWLPSGADALDALTGGALTVLGNLPVICSRAVTSPAAMELFSLAGMPVPARTIPFSNEGEYERLLADAARRRERLVFQHVHAPGERPASLYWVSPKLLSRLNNKANLPEFVPAEYVPARRTVPLGALAKIAGEIGSRPIVLKGAGPRSSGGCNCVVIARQAADVTGAARCLADCEVVVVEEFLEIEKNYCLNFATVSGAVRYLGGSEQAMDAKDAYVGNWLDGRAEPPRLAIEVGEEIMRAAMARGYRGVAGFDMIVDRQGALKVIDLNFRLNGSTPGVLWRKTLHERYGNECVARFLWWRAPGTLEQYRALIKDWIRAGHLLPLMIFDPANAAYPVNEIRLQALLIGESRRQVEAIQNEINADLRLHAVEAAEIPTAAAALRCEQPRV